MLMIELSTPPKEFIEKYSDLSWDEMKQKWQEEINVTRKLSDYKLISRTPIYDYEFSRINDSVLQSKYNNLELAYQHILNINMKLVAELKLSKMREAAHSPYEPSPSFKSIYGRLEL